MPEPIEPSRFNRKAVLPYGLTIDHIHAAMSEFVAFLGLVNQTLHAKGLQRLETMLMPANFSSIVGEFMVANIPRYCPTLVKNQYHNGYPDLVPRGRFSGDAVLHGDAGIEVKGSRYLRGWHGHNQENVWLIIFVFSSNRPVDASKNIQPASLRFVKVLGAYLTAADWTFSGRSEGSRRTITASVNHSGYEKLAANWIYEASATGAARATARGPRRESSEPPVSG